MDMTLTRVRTGALRLRRRPTELAPPAAACSWDALRATYEEQAARGVPEAVEGLRLIDQDRWPTSGRPRSR